MGQAPEENTPIDMSFDEPNSLAGQTEHEFTLGIPMRRPFKGELVEEIDGRLHFDICSSTIRFARSLRGFGIEVGSFSSWAARMSNFPSTNESIERGPNLTIGSFYHLHIPCNDTHTVKAVGEGDKSPATEHSVGRLEARDATIGCR